jgi:hypothetical protein
MSKSTKIERRGGARANTGGARVGAGRKPALQCESVKRAYTIALDLALEIERFCDRGFKTKSEYANHLLQKALKDSVD